jgi:hypothetical protein
MAVSQRESLITYVVGLYRRIRAIFLGTERSSPSSSISFEQFVIIAAFWRVPSLVPDDLKRLRIKRVGEVELMAHALTIYRFLRGCVARTRQRELQPLIADMALVSAVVRYQPASLAYQLTLEAKPLQGDIANAPCAY